jgi:uncharacterized protein (TIGR02996 family)
MPMEHPDWPALAAAIIADPDDDTVRLAAADFLEENGDPDRAAFIRIQIELARLAAMGEGQSLEADHLRAKERAFLGPLSVHAKLWAAEACPELVQVNVRGGSGIDVGISGAERLTWARGFVEGIRCPAEVWVRHGAAVRKRQPIRSLILTDCGPISRGQWYAFFPVLRGLRIVTLQGVDQSTGRWIQGWLVAGEIVLAV